MAKPIPSADQIDAIESTVSEQTNQQTALTQSAALQDPRIDRATDVDQAFKDLFDYYNDDIIGKYDAEKKAISGVFVTAPVVEADIIGVSSNPPSGRLTPTPPVQDIIRIPEFDGGNTSTAANYEQKHILDQAEIEDILVNGYVSGGGFTPGTAVTDSSLTGASTSLDVVDPTNPLTIAVNDIIVIEGMSEIAVVKITSVTDNMGGDPPYEFTYGIQVLVPPAGTIVAGANLSGFTGFTNGERTTKTASNPIYQPLMNYLVSALQTHINARKARLTEQLNALNTNEDPDGTANIATAITNVNTSNAFLTAYLITTDISNAGLATLSTERGVRSAQLTTRLSQISAAYTGQTEDYYDARYNIANSRGNTSRGTLRAKTNEAFVKSNCLAMAAGLADSIAALNGILP